jgi:hypothetical protein
MTKQEMQEMLERFDAVNIWLIWTYDQRNDRKAAQAFAQTLLKTADPRVRRIMRFTLEQDRQTVLYMNLFCRN